MRLRQRIWKRIPYTVKCLCHAVRSLCERDWEEAKYDLHKTKSHIMWYLRAIYRPYNCLRIRNVTRKYCCDHDMLLFHAAFSVLCEHVEISLGGPVELHKQILERRADEDPYGADSQRTWADAEEKMLGLYQWYTGVDWDKPVSIDGKDRTSYPEYAQNHEHFHNVLCQEKFHELIDIRAFMWT